MVSGGISPTLPSVVPAKFLPIVTCARASCRNHMTAAAAAAAVVTIRRLRECIILLQSKRTEGGANLPIAAVQRQQNNCGLHSRRAGTLERLEARRMFCDGGDGDENLFLPPVEVGQGIPPAGTITVAPATAATIVWTNRGSSSSDTDRFNSVFGANADLARGV